MGATAPPSRIWLTRSPVAGSVRKIVPRSASVSQVAVLRMMRSVSVVSSVAASDLFASRITISLTILARVTETSARTRSSDLALERDDRVGERGRIGEPRLRVLGDRRGPRIASELRRKVGTQARDLRGRLPDDAADQPRGVVVVERDPSREHLVEEDAHCVDVGGHARRRRPAGARAPGTGACPERCLGLGNEAAALDGDSEVHEARLSVFADHHVLRLQIPVEHADAVRRGEAVADPLCDREAPAEGKDLFLQLDLLEGLAREVLHRDELLAFDLDEVVDATDVLVGDPPGQDDLAAQRLPPLRREAVGTDPLQSDLAVELQVPRPVDDPHPAETEDLFDPVAAAENGSGAVGDFVDGGSRRRGASLARGTLAFPHLVSRRLDGAERE